MYSTWYEITIERTKSDYFASFSLFFERKELQERKKNKTNNTEPFHPFHLIQQQQNRMRSPRPTDFSSKQWESLTPQSPSTLTCHDPLPCCLASFDRPSPCMTLADMMDTEIRPIISIFHDGHSHSAGFMVGEYMSNKRFNCIVNFMINMTWPLILGYDIYFLHMDWCNFITSRFIFPLLVCIRDFQITSLIKIAWPRIKRNIHNGKAWSRVKGIIERTCIGWLCNWYPCSAI